MFDALLDNLHANIISHDGIKIDLSKDFKEYSLNNGSVIRNWLWDVPGFRRWRITRLDAGEKLQVLNSVAYPEFTKDQPILGVDLLWFGGRKKLVSVMDFQPLLQEKKYFERHYAELKKLNNTFSGFNNHSKMSKYDPNKYFSPWVIFCKSKSNEFNDLLPEIFNSFLNSYWKIQKNNLPNLIDSQIVKNLQIEYDKYSAERDPAHGLFSSFFGKEWSDKFLKEFLFPLS